jgi:hypothetical protein
VEKNMSRLLGPIRQSGFVVPDLDKALEHWIGHVGIGPWFLIDNVKAELFWHRGAESAVEMRVALANSGELQIELIEQTNAAPSMFREFLDAGGLGLQHLGFWTCNYQFTYDRMCSLGYRVGQEGRIGGPNGRFAYFEATGPHAGTVIELSDISGGKGAFFDTVRQAAIDWDGSDPIRPIVQVGSA